MIWIPILALIFVVLLWLSLPAVRAAADPLFEDGPVGFDRGMNFEQAPWAESTMALPALPGDTGELIRLNVSTGGLSNTLYIDPSSLSTADDRVVRYTVVIVSGSGVRNVTYEALHCGERKVRRIAYAVDDSWHELKHTGWQRITGTGMNQYRKYLYENYFCDTGNRYLDADEIIRKLESGIDPATTEY